MDDLGKMLTVDEVAAILRVTPKTVRNLLNAAKLPGVKIGRVWRVSEAALWKHLLREAGPRGDE